MCRKLNIPRSSFYYKPSIKNYDVKLDNLIIDIFKNSRNNYGSRKIKQILKNDNINVSRKRIRKIMIKYSLVSNYTKKQFKKHNLKTNTDEVANVVDRQFNNRQSLDVIVSDLTYVKVVNKWYYICLIIDLFNREIIGFGASKYKDAHLVYKAFKTINFDIKKVNIFHTDRGGEFKNALIDDFLSDNNINRSLSKAGCPYDNAVAEATYKIIKTEFAYDRVFGSFEELERDLFDYVNWYNNHRIHSSLNYLTPNQFRLINT